MLRTLETLLALPALEFRKTDRMRVTEKVFVGGIKVADGIQEDKVHVAMLRTLETLLALPALEFRKTDRMRVTEKVFVGGIKVADGIQEGL